MTVKKKSVPDSLVAADIQSASFRQTRQARRLELVEDYVELIDDLIAARGEARQVDIAERLGVAQPTVAKMLKRLAEEARERHHIVEAFLLALGVSPETARLDAEGIEHHVSSETLDAFRIFAKRQQF